MTRQKRKNPRAGRRRGSGIAAALGQSTSQRHATPSRTSWQDRRLPRNWRERLPEPETYYRARVETLGPRHGNGWAQGRCPFHDDGTASLSVHLDHPRGGWRCFAGCGSGDLLAFHMRLSGMGFVEAVRDLIESAQ
jgi:hypothetical protein